jgi:dihydrofolate reductase
MIGKIICNIAISIDGYIADDHDGFDWIEGHHDTSLDTHHPYSFESFLENIDVVIMGRRCYELNMHEQFKDKQVLIFTSQEKNNDNHVTFVTHHHEETLKELKAKGHHLYIFGGGVLISNLLHLELVDELILGIIPKLLGSGIPLFHKGYPKQSFKLVGSKIEGGIVILMYERL